MRILLLEDDPEQNRILKEFLTQKQFVVDSYLDGKSVLENLDRPWELYILDLNVPFINGLELLEEIRRIDRKTPAIIISSENDIDTVLKSFERGCNDFLRKPFDPRELLARIASHTQNRPSCFLIDEHYRFDLGAKLLFCEEDIIPLTKKELRLLEILALHEGRVASLEEITNHVWGYYQEVDGTSLRGLVSRLRKKLPAGVIKNHTDVGYQLEGRVERP